MTSGSFAILGAGRLGRTLGRLLARRGHTPLGISCRTLRSARSAVAFIGAGRPTTSNTKAAAGSSLVLIATPDRVIAPLARELADSGLPWRGRVVAHTSGALASGALEPLRRRGAQVASLHPLASIADPREGFRRFHGIPFAIEGDPKAVRALRRLVESLGGVPITIPRQAKALYHLVACLLSNDLVALLSFGLDAARALGLSRREAIRLYLPLVRGTVDNVDRLGPVKALTGPVSRGDVETLRLHGEALRTLSADFRRLHRLLALRSSTLALEARTITPEVAARLARLLGSLP
jgi:predicted short-subunit dehydrogenase-like oxidoreductase (DUF2520 family)